MLTALLVKNFRCFDEVELTELRKVNILVGPNNVGKTAMMTALRRLTRIDSRHVPRIPVADGVGVWGADHSIRFRKSDLRSGLQPSITVTIQEGDGQSPTTLAIPQGLSTSSGETNTQNKKALREFASRIVYIPSRRRVPTDLRRQDPTLHEERRYDGSDLLVDLIEGCVGREHPSRREILEGYLSSLLGTAAKTHLTIDPPDLRLGLGEGEARSLSDLGEGITQLLVIAGAAASVPSPIILLEEPETGLHPALQRRLLDFLVSCPNLQCILSTHSNHLLDHVHPDINIYRFSVDGADSRSIDQIAYSDLRTLAELGVRPSSVAATNCVIWVEGPTDAMYLGAWLSHQAPDLEHWRDYAFAFFGGALLEHASVDDGDSLVRLVRINPSFYLVADSDRSSEEEPLGKEYLRRLQGSLPLERIWITQGREIENYLSDRLLKQALGRDPENLPQGQVGLPGTALASRLKSLDLPSSTRKVVLAEKVVSEWSRAPEWPLDLQQRVHDLARFVRACKDKIPAVEVSARYAAVTDAAAVQD